MENKGNKKLIWYILFAFITIIMCYLFCVVYFFYISPYDISLKTKLWPFLTNSQLGSFYDDAVVEIKYEALDEEYFGYVNVSISGVNVRQDGYIITPYSSLEGLNEETEIQIFPNSGECYSGKLLHVDKSHNLAILKCESLDGKAIKMPYVKIAQISDQYIVNSDVIAVDESHDVFIGAVDDYNLVEAKTSVSEGVYKVDYVMEYCFSVDFEKSFTNGMVFDKSGSFMGFSINEGESIFMNAESAKLYLNKVIECEKNEARYSNALVESFNGFDTYEVAYFIEQSSKNSDKSKFYFDGAMQEYTDNINYFARANQTGFFIFKDLTYKEELILSSESVVSKVLFENESCEIDCRDDLLTILYEAQEGDSITIYYYQIDSLGSQTKSVKMVV